MNWRERLKDHNSGIEDLTRQTLESTTPEKKKPTKKIIDGDGNAIWVRGEDSAVSYWIARESIGAMSIELETGQVFRGPFKMVIS